MESLLDENEKPLRFMVPVVKTRVRRTLRIWMVDEIFERDSDRDSANNTYANAKMHEEWGYREDIYRHGGHFLMRILS